MKNKFCFWLFVTLMTASFQGYCFWIGLESFDGSHQQITSRAARQYKYDPNNISYKNICSSDNRVYCEFSDSVISTFTDQNRWIDLSGTVSSSAIAVIDDNGIPIQDLTGINPKFHCDEEQIHECSNIIYNGRDSVYTNILVVNKLFKENAPANDIQKVIIGAQTVLGQISHTLQDFYAHSNWVERQIYDNSKPLYTGYDYKTDNIGESKGYYPEFINKNFEFVKSKVFNETTCFTSNGGTSIYLRELFTGYYEDAPDIYGFYTENASASNGLGYYSDDTNKNGPYYPNWKFLPYE